MPVAAIPNREEKAIKAITSAFPRVKNGKIECPIPEHYRNFVVYPANPTMSETSIDQYTGSC